MISLLVSSESFVCVKDHITELTLIGEGVRIVNTFNVIPGVSSLVTRVLITNGTHESRARLPDILIKVLRLCNCHPLNIEGCKKQKYFQNNLYSNQWPYSQCVIKLYCDISVCAWPELCSCLEPFHRTDTDT